MAKYRKKPVVIEAHQITQRNLQDMASWPPWLSEAWEKGLELKEIDLPLPTIEPGAFYLDDDGVMVVETLEGAHPVSCDDDLIKGVKGELYPCKPDIFGATYERVVEEEGARQERPA